MRKLPRGVRNNNPGNVDYSPLNKWVGQVGIEQDVPNPRFARFDIAQNGIRAITKILMSYHRKGFNTVRLMINRWAPPKENDTGAYVKAVADRLDIGADTELTLSIYLLQVMVTAIIQHENGYLPYNSEIVRDGVSRAFQ